jgi:hypothetical protein
MIEYLSPAVLAAVLRVSSTPIFSVHLAVASLLARREVSGRTARPGQRRAATAEGKQHV